MTIARQHRPSRRRFGCALERRHKSARRYRVRAGEIDIVALDGRCLVFVEVKSRQNGRFGGAAVAVRPWKRRKIVAVATEYLARHRVDAGACRFDVVTVASEPDGPRVKIIRNAFDAS